MASVFTLQVPRGTIHEEEVRRFLGIVLDPEAWTQIHAAPAWHCRSVQCDQIGKVVSAVASLAVDATAVYVSLNPLERELKKSAVVGDVACRRWLLVDVDPTRPDDASATDEEHEASRHAAYKVMAYLAERGWPLPLVVDSGNGWHLLYRISLPNDAEARVLCRDTIAVLAGVHDTAEAKIDRKVHDARRITKVAGTLTRKGPDTPDRPHRWSRLVFVPDSIEVVEVDLLKELAGNVQVPARGEIVRRSIWSLTTYASRESAYVGEAIEQERAKVALSPVGNRNNQLNESGFRLGTLVGAGVIGRERVIDVLAAAALESGLSGEEIERTLPRAIDDGARKPRDMGFLRTEEEETPSPSPEVVNGKHPDQQTRRERRQQPVRPRRDNAPTIIRFDHLATMDLPEPRWAVPGLLSEGLSMLAGRPKQGKSMVALNLALTIVGGGMALGSMPTTEGDVLYISLEDRLRRVRERAGKVIRGSGGKPSGRLFVAVEWPKQDQGGMGHIAEWLEDADNPRLVIIDTWGRFRAQTTGKRSAYDEDYEAMSGLKIVLDAYDCSGLVVHHTKKGKSEDMVEDVSGTMGLSGAADGVLVLARVRGETEAVLHVTGRDVEEQKLSLSFDKETLTWTCLGDAKLRTDSKIQQKIMDLFKANTGCFYWPSDVCGLIDESRDTVKKTMLRMSEKGVLRRIGGGKYGWPTDEGSF